MRINAGKPASRLHDGKNEYAKVWEDRAFWSGPVIRWAWQSNITKGFAKNEADAKAAAMAFVQEQLKNTGGNHA